MARQKDLAKLVVRLEAEVAKYMKGMDDAQKRLEKFTKSAASLGTIGKAIDIAIGSVVTQRIVSFGKAAIDSADAVGKLSQSTGIGVETLSSLQYAAKASNVEVESLAGALGKLSKLSAESVKAGKEQSAALKALGLSSRDANGGLKDSEELLLEIAERFSEIEDGPAKAAAAMDLFGKSGASLIPFLNQGRDGIKALTEEAKRLGFQISEDTAKKAAQFNDNVARIKSTFIGVTQIIASRVLPELVHISEQFSGIATDGENLDEVIDQINNGFKLVATTAVIVNTAFQAVGKSIGAVVGAFAQFDWKPGDFAGPGNMLMAIARNAPNASRALNVLKEGWNDVADDIEKSADRIGQIWKDQDDVLKEVSITVRRRKEDFTFDTEGADEAAKAAEKALEKINEMTEGLQQQADTFGMNEVELMRYRISVGDLAETFKEAGAAGKSYQNDLISLTNQIMVMTDVTKEATVAIADFGSQNLDALEANLDSIYAELEKDLEESTGVMNEFQKEAARNTQNIIADTLRNGFDKGADDVLDIFYDMITELSAQAVAANIAEKLFGKDGAGGGLVDDAFSWIGGLLGGMKTRDTGGRGEKGVPYMIGTGAQPEIFIPDQPGHFYPRGEGINFASGSSRPITQNIYVTGRVDQRSARQLELESLKRQRTANARLG